MRDQIMMEAELIPARRVYTLDGHQSIIWNHTLTHTQKKVRHSYGLAVFDASQLQGHGFDPKFFIISLSEIFFSQNVWNWIYCLTIVSSPHL